MREPKIIHEDRDFVAVEKPAGMPVHEARHSDDFTLVDWLIPRYPEIKDVGDFPAEAFREGGRAFGQPYRPGIVHRLDKQTSGIMVVARTDEGFKRLKELFQKRETEKKYLALVCGSVKENRGTIEKPIGRLLKTPMKMGIDFGKGGVRLVKPAVTEFVVKERLKSTTYLEARPHTGRMHQIRLHLASIGHPVAGDKIYGGEKVCHADLGRYFLHAYSLSFTYRPGELLHFEADLPEELENILAEERRRI